MPLTIETRFAIDRNHNKTVEPEEIVDLKQLAEKDADRNGVLQDGEFEDVYFEYAHDKWIPADREYREPSDGYVTVVKMNKLDLKTGAVDISVSIHAG